MTKYFAGALENVGKDWGGYVIATLVYIAITAVLGITYIGGLLSGCFMIGYFYFMTKKFKGEKAEVADLFIAFKKAELLMPSLLAGIVMGIIMVIGFILLIIPGIMAMAAFLFTYLIILDGEKDFWAAMMKSKDIVAKDWVKYCIFALFTAAIIMIGGIVIIGVLVTMPIAIGAVVLAYEDIKIK